MYVKLKCNDKEMKMKKLLVILISMAGLNAYALGPLSVYNDTTAQLAAECFPSKFFCNGLKIAGGQCTCPYDDNVLYFGRVGMPHTQAYLDEHTTFTATFDSLQITDYHVMGNGNVWKLQKDIYDTDNKWQTCDAAGVPNDTIDCDFSS